MDIQEFPDPYGYIEFHLGDWAGRASHFRVAWYATVAPEAGEMEQELFGADSSAYFFGQEWDGEKKSWIMPCWIRVPANAYKIASWIYREVGIDVADGGQPIADAGNSSD